MQPDAPCPGLGIQGFADELRTVVDDHLVGGAPSINDALQGLHDPGAGQRGVDVAGRRLANASMRLNTRNARPVVNWSRMKSIAQR